MLKKQTALKPNEELVRVNAQVTETEHQKLKIHAAKQKVSITELLRKFIQSLPD